MTLKRLAAKITHKNAHLITLSDNRKKKGGTMLFKALKTGFVEDKGVRSFVNCQLKFRLFVSFQLKFWPFASCQLTQSIYLSFRFNHRKLGSSYFFFFHFSITVTNIFCAFFCLNVKRGQPVLKAQF